MSKSIPKRRHPADLIALDVFRRLGKLTLIYFAIVLSLIAVLIAVMQLPIVKEILHDDTITVNWEAIREFLSNGLGALSQICMIILGAICQLTFFNWYVKVGVTRQQFYLGAICAAIFISTILSLLKVLLIIALGGEIALIDVFNYIFHGCLHFVLGYMFTIGFAFFNRVLPMLGGITFSMIGLNLLGRADDLDLTRSQHTLIAIVGFLLILAVQTQIIKRTPIKA